MKTLKQKKYQGNLKNRKGKENRGRIFFHFLTKFPGVDRVFNVLESLRKEERLSCWHQECYPGDSITERVKRKPGLSIHPAQSPLSVIFLMTGLKAKYMALQTIFIS